MTELPLSLPLHINLSPVQHLSDLTLMPSSACYPTTNATSCPQNKMLAEVADWGTSLVEHVSYIAQCTTVCLILEWFRPGMVPHVIGTVVARWSDLWNWRQKLVLLCVCLINFKWTCQVRKFYYTNLAQLPLSFFWMLIIFRRNFKWKWLAV